jgi:hypothetical protein
MSTVLSPRRADAPASAPASVDVAPWPLRGTPLRSAWRLLAALGAFTEAAGHIPVTQMHLTEAPYIGVGFVLLTVAGFALAHLLLSADTPAVWAWTGVVGALALLGYLLSRTVGLPQIRDDIGNWSEPLGVVCIIGEAVMLVAALAQLSPRASGGHAD